MVRTVAHRAAIRKRTYPTCCAVLCDVGAQPEHQLDDAPQVLGHSSLGMIQRTYAQSTPAYVHELMARLLADDRLPSARVWLGGAGSGNGHLPADHSAPTSGTGVVSGVESRQFP